MINKYRLKKGNIKMQIVTEICLRCGKTRQREYVTHLPLPNHSYIGKPSWSKCMMGNHYFYRKDEVELNA